MKLQERRKTLLKLFNEEVNIFEDTEETKILLIDRWINQTLGSMRHIKNKLDREYNKMLDDLTDLFKPLTFTKKYKDLNDNLNDLKLELEALYIIKHIDLIKEIKK